MAVESKDIRGFLDEMHEVDDLRNASNAQQEVVPWIDCTEIALCGGDEVVGDSNPEQGIVAQSKTPKLLPIPYMAIWDGSFEQRATCTEFRLTVNDLVKPTLQMMNIDSLQMFSDEKLATQITCKRGCEDFPHSFELLVWGTVLGKWSDEHACKGARRLIKEAIDTSKKCDGMTCKGNPTGKHMLCHINYKLIQTGVNPTNNQVTHFLG